MMSENSPSGSNPTPGQIDPRTRRSIESAVEHLANDGSVGFPSETVWGLAARATSDKAVAALRLWKGRGDDQPVSLLVSGEEALKDYGFEVSPLASTLMSKCWPGPLTIVLPCSRPFAPGIPRNADGAVGVRCSSHPIALALDEAAQEAGLGLLTATSLNRTGAPPAQTEEEARLLCGPSHGAPFVIESCGMGAMGGLPSTVLDLTTDAPTAIRWGALGRAALHALVGIEFPDHQGEK
jgi:L-threonylcarbamoyladenylate synthase